MKKGGAFGESYGQKTTQKRTKIELSGILKIFKFWKLWNCKSDMTETWPRYVPPQYLSFTKKQGCQSLGRTGVHKKTHQKMAKN